MPGFMPGHDSEDAYASFVAVGKAERTHHHERSADGGHGASAPLPSLPQSNSPAANDQAVAAALCAFVAASTSIHITSQMCPSGSSKLRPYMKP